MKRLVFRAPRPLGRFPALVCLLLATLFVVSAATAGAQYYPNMVYGEKRVLAEGVT